MRSYASIRSALRLSLATAAAALFLLGSATAADFGALKPDGYVSDFARVLDPGTVSQLNEYCKRVQDSTKAEIAIVTLPTLEGEPVEDVANLLFRKWGIGQKGENNGALLLLVINDRKSRLELGYGLEPILPDGFAGQILREMRPALRRQDYATALSTAAAHIGETIAKSKGVEISGAKPRRAKRSAEPGPLGFGALIVVVLLLMLMGAGRRRYAQSRYTPGGRAADVVTGLLLGALMNGGHRSRGGGGFGGYDSGDSFGGFGGGDSGGGGASSDW